MFVYISLFVLANRGDKVYELDHCDWDYHNCWFYFVLAPAYSWCSNLPITSGIVLTSVGRDSLGSITVAIAYPCAVSLGLKLLACTLQQVSVGVLCFQHRLIRHFLA